MEADRSLFQEAKKGPLRVKKERDFSLIVERMPQATEPARPERLSRAGRCQGSTSVVAFRITEAGGRRMGQAANRLKLLWAETGGVVRW